MATGEELDGLRKEAMKVLLTKIAELGGGISQSSIEKPSAGVRNLADAYAILHSQKSGRVWTG